MHIKAVRRADIASGACRMTGRHPLMGIQGQNICLAVPDDFSLNTKIRNFHPEAIPLPAGAELIPSCAFALHTVD